MRKEHFPVNDKSIADVNKANAKAYDASIQVGPNIGATGKEKEKLMRPSEREKRGIPQEGAEIVIGKKKSGDHVRESSQEKGESHDKAGSTPTGRYAQTPSHKIGETPKMSIKNEKIAAKIAKGLSKVMQRQG